MNLMARVPTLFLMLSVLVIPHTSHGVSQTKHALITKASQNDGTRMTTKDSAGDFMIRTGVNVSHWLSQSDRRGEERRKVITKADFDSIASAGFDHVRIPVDEVQLWDSVGHKEAEAFELLHHAIHWAFAAHLRVIVDLHIIRSHYFGAESNVLWTNPAEQKKLADMWLQLSDELRSYPNDKLAYEILNEAVAKDPEDWNKVLNMVIHAVRSKEPTRKIVVGSNMWQLPETFPVLKIPENDRNIILSFHFYVPLALTHHTAPWTPFAEYKGSVTYPGQIVDTVVYKNLSPATVDAMRSYANGYFTKKELAERMAPAIAVARKLQLPLFCGEFGIYPAIPEETALRWYKDVCDIFNENGIAYCHWTYKGDFPVVNPDGSMHLPLVSILTGAR